MSRTGLESEAWLQDVFKQLGAVKQPYFPSTWTARGIVAAMRYNVADSLFYLLVVLGNAAFLSWLTINILGHSWAKAYSSAQHGRLRPTIQRGWFTELICGVLFFYLPNRLRWIMLKDLRGFARDPRLLVIYVLNLRRIPLDLENPHVKGMIAFLNLTTVSLILATFTSRFVYPLLSLESQQLWLLELLPIRRITLLMVKFLFAITVTGLSGCAVMGLAVRILDLPPSWAGMNLLACLGVCTGLSGLSIGLGARFPVLGNRNPARIASGFGGTFNLIASMVFVGLVLTGVGVVSFNEIGRAYHLPSGISPTGWIALASSFALSILVAAAALLIGARHFEQLEY
jgi:ABC-2 type transport system permease protein